MLVTSKGILNIPHLEEFVQEQVLLYSSHNKPHQSIVAGWGRKKSYLKAKQYADVDQLDLVCLEDGFIRSIGLGKQGIPPFSLVLDKTGIYFDARQSSDLEELITKTETLESLPKTLSNIEQILKLGVTKYNLPFTKIDNEIFGKNKNILVVDQTYGDQSIHYSGASSKTFDFMLLQALNDHPDATIWIKTHPDVMAGKAKGHYSKKRINDKRIKWCTDHYNPYAFMGHMAEIYVVSSQLGFEALLCGKAVKCFGLPWYAGWGLTNDQYAPLELLKDRRQVTRSLEQVFYCAYMQYARYVSPITGLKCELGDILKLLEVNLPFQNHFDPNSVAYDFSRWKKGFIGAFLKHPNDKVNFLKYRVPSDQFTTYAWGSKASFLKEKGFNKVITIEDGFVRSRGLGAQLIRPYSLIFDDMGIYYDATKASRLECILNQIELTTDQRSRVEHLINALIDLNITKYNLDNHTKLQKPKQAKKVLLVVGQVEDDLSVQYGGVDIKTNLDLIQCVRKNDPQAYIIYKPHPDVHAGLRVGKVSEMELSYFVNHVETQASILECFEICDEIHTISSLSGFEALLRGIKVYCYGLPFYAGWGLTCDSHPCERRVKSLSLDELVYGALIEYAAYNLPQGTVYNVARVNIEDVIAQLITEKNEGSNSPSLRSIFARIRAKLLLGV